MSVTQRSHRTHEGDSLAGGLAMSTMLIPFWSRWPPGFGRRTSDGAAAFPAVELVRHGVLGPLPGRRVVGAHEGGELVADVPELRMAAHLGDLRAGRPLGLDQVQVQVVPEVEQA